MTSVCFTGHRKIDSSDMYALKSLLDSTICGLVKRGVTDFYCGGALGFDTMCAHMVLYLRKRKALDIKLHLVLPCSNEEQTKNWSYNDKQEFYAIMMAADSIEYIGSEYTKDCMQKRNKFMIDNSSRLIAAGSSYRSGTGQTIRLAEKAGIDINVINIAKIVEAVEEAKSMNIKLKF